MVASPQWRLWEPVDTARRGRTVVKERGLFQISHADDSPIRFVIVTEFIVPDAALGIDSCVATGGVCASP